MRTAFKFGYKDLPGKFNPALALQTFRITKKDRPPVDPFTIQEAETIIATAHRIHGEWYGNYEEFRFFTGLRQSEQFALEIGDCDLEKGIDQRDKGRRSHSQKEPNQDQPGPRNRASALARRKCFGSSSRFGAEWSLRAKFSHPCVFFTEGGEPFQTIYLPYNRWREIMDTLSVRYRKPYNSRHSYISWRLMVGHNRLLVAQEDGHSVATMERTYAAWIEGRETGRYRADQTHSWRIVR